MLKKRAMSEDKWLMTLPDERYRAIITAERLLKDLCDPSVTPRIPKTVRDRARGALRHYPSGWDMKRAAAACPEVFAEHLDPLYKMVKQHDLNINEPLAKE